MANKPNLTVIQGGTGGTGGQLHGSFIPTGVRRHDGKEYFVPGDGPASPAPPPGGGTDVNTRLDKLEQHRTWLWTVLSGAIGLAVAAIVGSFFILDDRIQDRFDVADNRNREISKSLSDLNTEITVQGRGIEQILERVDGYNPEASSGAK